MNSPKPLKEQCAQLLSWIKERKKPQSLGKDAFPVFAAFDGDNTLSVILSKAFLLTEDTKIKDKTILSQIRST